MKVEKKKGKGAPAGYKKHGTAQVTPQPSNKLPSNVRCFIRYGNSGGPYRICVDGEGFKDPVKTPPQKVAPLITPQEFVKQRGKKSYADLSEGQKKEYHRLDMANRRRDERELEKKGAEEVKKQKELDRLEKQKARAEKAQKAIEKKVAKAQAKEKKAIKVLKKVKKIKNPKKKKAEVKEAKEDVSEAEQKINKLKAEMKKTTITWD